MSMCRAIARIGLIGVLVTATAARAQRTDNVTGERLTGFVLPIEPVDGGIEIIALRARAWVIDDTQRLMLDGGVRIRVGGYDIQGQTAVVWLNRIPSAAGLISQLAVYLPEVQSPANRSGLGVSGADVLMTASTRGPVTLDVARLDRRPPPPTGLLRQAERRLAALLRPLLQEPLPPLSYLPQIDQPRPASPAEPQPGGTPVPPTPTAPQRQRVRAPSAGVETPPLFGAGGTVWFSWNELNVISGEDENVITATGSIVVQYIADSGDNRWSQITLTAQRAVVFADPGPLDTLLTGRVDADTLRGIYLEGNAVATAGNGEYTVRAPQMYYDFDTGQAIMVDAILRTYSREHRIPIYARAQELRQVAANQWTAERARVSTSEFFTPHFAIGARQVTVTQRPGAEDRDSTLFFESRDNTLEVEGVPLLYWPKFAGTAEDVPVRGLEVGYRDTDGVRILTKWDPFVLLGMEKPRGVDATTKLDGFAKRGAGGGLDLTYDLAAAMGKIDLYYLYDTGTDRTSSGLDVEPAGENRGLALWSHRHTLNEDWYVRADLSYISDETFITTWREEDFYNRHEYETAAYLRYTGHNSAFDTLFKYDVNDFISNSYLLASRAYQVEKVPELTYRRYGDSLFDDLLTYSGETRLSRMRFSFQEGTPRQLGVRPAVFGPGIGPNDSISAAFIAAGFPTGYVNRFDARHEFAMPVRAGPVKITPYVVGRFTAWSSAIESFSTDAKDTRLFGAVGVRFNTQVQYVDNTVESKLFDLHRLRTIIEPRLTAWYGYTDVPDGALPVYDQGVESIGGASVVEIGLNTTWQTQRGGPGRWRSVDVLKIDTSLVMNSGDANRESPTPQFFAYRPEYSQFGDHVQMAATWTISDSLAMVGQATYDLDNSVLARGSIGTNLRHTPLLSTYVEYRFIDADDTELLGVGWQYDITSKYNILLLPQWDFVASDFRAVSIVVVRRFPDFDFTLRVTRDEITDQTTVGASLDLVEF